MSSAQPDFWEESGDGLASRQAALALLDTILSRKIMLDAALDREESFRDLSPRDRAFARMIVATILRRRGQLDDIITRASAKGETPRPETLRYILYIGLGQLLFMNVPDHAAVNTSVTLTAQNGLDGKKAFVNALLRRAAGDDGKIWLAAQDEAALNIPSWLYQCWINAYGADRAKEIAQASLTEAPLDITVKEDGGKESWRDCLNAELLSTGSLRLRDAAPVPSLDGFDDGAWWVQDASSALPAHLFGDIAGMRVLDLCAAPGGKTMQLAAMGAQVTALDRSAARMTTLSRNLARTNLQGNVTTIIEDGATYTPREPFSFILLDAPCTATGTIRRHPDLLHLKTVKDQNGLTDIQARLLANAGRILASGGTLLYCTCSLQKEEGEDQVSAFLNQNPSFRRNPIRQSEIGGLGKIITADGDVRLTPVILQGDGGMDGFYIARLTKTA